MGTEGSGVRPDCGVTSKNTIAYRKADTRRPFCHKWSCSNGSSKRSNNMEWKRYSNQRLKVSKVRLTGHEDGTRYQQTSCSSKISVHTSSRCLSACSSVSYGGSK